MSNVIDRRIVEMDFDNANFERNAKTSLSTIDKLKAALDFKGSANSLSELSKSAQHFNMFNVENAAEAVKNRFSAMEIIGVGALMRIGQQAVDTGEKLIKSMSTDQIMAGWDKFAKKTTSTATLLGQGFDMGEVTDQLERLNWFTDETSYNFTDMVDNIGKFTASGKGLTESVDAMMGIANWAALSGQNAQTASRAMYQLSQAMGAGVMRKEDYKSIQNAAMDTDEFRQKALDAAVALGTLRKNANGTYQSLVATGKGAEAFTKQQFTEKLTEGLWFTDKVMMQVFNDYSKGVEDVKAFADANDLLASEVIGAKDALSKGEEALDEYVNGLDIDDKVKKELKTLVKGLDDFGLKAFGAAQKARTFEDAIDSVKDAASTTWMNIFELFIGNAEEATEVWTDLANYLYDVFVEPLNGLYDLFDEWISELDNGSDDIIQIFRNIAAIAESITKPIKEAFSDIFPKKSGSDFKRFITNLNNILVKMKLNSDQARKLKNIFSGLFTVIKTGLGITKAILKALKPLTTFLGSIIDKILTLGSAIGETITQTASVESSFNKLEQIIANLVEYIKDFIGVFGYMFEVFKRRLGEGQNFFVAFAKLVYSELAQAIAYIGNFAIDTVETLLGIKLDKVREYFLKFTGFIDDIFFGLVNSLTNGDGLEGAINFLFEVLKGVGKKVIEVFEKVTGIDLSEFKVKFEKTVESIRDNLLEFVQSFDGIEPLTSKFEKLANALDRIKAFFTPLAEAVRNFVVEVLDKIKDYPWLSFQTLFNAKMISEMVKSITSLIEAVPNLLKSFTELKDSITGTLSAIKDSIKAYTAEIKVKTLYAIAGALAVLGVALLLIGSVDSNKIASVVGALAVSLISLTGALWAFSQIAERMGGLSAAKIATSVLAIAGALYIMSQALVKIGESGANFDEIGQNLIAMFFVCMYLVALLMVIDMMDLSAKSITKILFVSVLMNAISSALLTASEALAILGQINAGQGLLALVDMFGILVGLVESAKSLQNVKGTKGLIVTAASLILIAEAVKILAEAINSIKVVDAETMFESFVTVAGGLEILVRAATNLNRKEVLLKTALSMILIAEAMKILSDVIVKLSEYNFLDMIGSVGVIAASLLALTIVLNSLKSTAFQAGLGLLAVAVALKIITGILINISKEDPIQMMTSIMILAGAFAALAVICNQLQSNIGGAFSLLLVAAGLFAISEALKVMNSLDMYKMMVDIMLVVSAMFVLSLVSKFATGCLPGAAALLVLAGAFTVFALGCSMLAKQNTTMLLENLVIALGAFLGIVIGIIGIGTIFAAFSGTILLGAAVFMAATALIAIGIAAFAGAMALLGIAANTLIATGAPASEAITLLGEALGKYYAALFLGALSLTALGAALILAAVGSTLMSIGGGLLAIVIAALAVALTALSGSIALLNLALGSLGDNTVKAANGMTVFGDALVSSAPNLIAGAIAMKAIIPELNDISDSSSKFASSIGSATDGLTSLSSAFASFIIAANNFITTVEKIGNSTSSLSKIITVTTTNISALLKSTEVIMRAYIPKFTVMGANLVVGFANGMNSRFGMAVGYASALGNACAAALRRTLQIHSPSRVTDEIAGYFMLGFANRLKDTTMVENASEEMGDAAATSLQAAMSSAYDNLNSDIEDPVIKPVLDLSEIQNGSRSLDAMISRDRATDIMASYRTRRSYEEEENAANRQAMGNFGNQLASAITANSAGELPVNVTVVLEGDADGVFNLVRVTNDRLIKSTGTTPLYG